MGTAAGDGLIGTAGNDTLIGLGGNEVRKHGPQLTAVTRIDPAFTLEAEVETARLRRNPDLPRGGVTVDDHLAAIVELELEDAARLGFDIDVRPTRLECGLDAGELGFGKGVECRLFHADSFC